MERKRLETLISKYPSLKIAVIGDLFLDKWLHIDRCLDETSCETGLTAYQVVGKGLYAGAAGTILSNLAALEVQNLTAIGFLGDDGEGYEMLRILNALGVNTEHVVVSDRVMTPTYTKPVFMRDDGHEETNRLDHKNTNPMPVSIEERIIESVRSVIEDVDAIIALDQLEDEGTGVLTPNVRRELSKIAEDNSGTIVFADSRRFIGKFHNMSVKCNDLEAMRLFDSPKEEKPSAADTERYINELFALTGRDVLLTCGSRGTLVRERGGLLTHVPSVPVTGKIDTVGAGDSFTAAAVSAMCAGADCSEAAFIGNIAASITIQVIGTTGTATRRQLLERFDEYCSKHHSDK